MKALEIKLSRLSDVDEEEIIGNVVREDVPGRPHLIWPLTVSFWQFLRRADIDDQVDKAKRVDQYITWLHDAEAASKNADLVTLKTIADAVRNCVGEIPSKIPKGGFRDVDDFEYPDPLPFEGIRNLLLADLKTRKLTEWFTAGEQIRKAGIQ